MDNSLVCVGRVDGYDGFGVDYRVRFGDWWVWVFCGLGGRA